MYSELVESAAHETVGLVGLLIGRGLQTFMNGEVRVALNGPTYADGETSFTRRSMAVSSLPRLLGITSTMLVVFLEVRFTTLI